MNLPESVETPENAPERRSLASIALEVVILFVIAYVIAYILGHFIFGNFEIQQRSMEPTVYESERVIINRLVYTFRSPERGDIIILLDPISRQRDFIKRVVGLPGEQVEVREGHAYVNGKRLKEAYLSKDTGQDRVGPIKIPPNQYYVMGDNRGNSTDSRAFGPIPRTSILGRVMVVWWPPDEIRAPK